MRLLLINNNPAVSRLINLSAKKCGYELEEFKSDDFDLNENYDVTIIDNEAANENSILLLRESGNLGDIIYIGPKGLPKPIYANYFLQKPFLPTDFIDLTKKIEKSKNKKEKKKEEALDANKENIESFAEHDKDDSEMAALDLDELDILDLPMPDDELLEEKSEKIDDDKEDENLKRDNANIDEIIGESDIEAVVDELSEEEISESGESNNEDLNLNAEDDTLMEGSPSILDSEDIDEVKKLLNDDVENEETKTVEEEMKIDNELVEENNDVKNAEAEKNRDISELIQEEEIKEPEVLDEIEETDEVEVPEVFDELEIPDVIEEKTEDDIEVAKIDEKESFDEDEDVISVEKSSIDDLTQDDLKALFDEENVEEETKAKNIDTEQLKEELQTKVKEDVKKILSKDEIREALKGLSVNVSISINEK